VNDIIDLYSDESIVSLTRGGDIRNSQWQVRHSGLVRAEVRYRHRAFPELRYAYSPDRTPSIRDCYQLRCQQEHTERLEHRCLTL